MSGKLGVRAATIVSVLMLGACSKPAQFTCPLPDKVPAGEIRERTAQLQATQVALGTGSEDEIASVVPGVGARHPGTSPDLIVNYLVVAFCPTIAARDAAADEKTQALEAFAKRARRIVRSLPH